MRYWIVPCRESTFLIDAALKANQDKKDGSTFVDWRQSFSEFICTFAMSLMILLVLKRSIKEVNNLT